MKTYVVLGGGGVFGVHTVKYLLDHANARKVIVVGRNPEKSAPFSLHVGKEDPRYEYLPLHVVLEQDRLFDLFDKERPELIISYAAQGESAASWRRSWYFFETNATALVRMCEQLMSRTYLERFIQIGTSELYGSVDIAATEDMPVRPTTPYAVSKAAFDLYLMSVSKVLKFPMNIIRPSNAYAPGQQLHRVIPRAVLCGLTGEKLPLQGGGRARKSYMHARDLARAILLVVEQAPLGTIYNVGPDQPVSIRELVEKVADALDMPFEQLCEVTADRLGEDAQYWLDSSALKRDVGWEPQIPLEEGLREMVDWGRTYLPELRGMAPDYVLRT
jgi:dTDP-glucose 4,6-dehydratase